MVYKVPSSSKAKQPTFEPFEFALEGKVYKMPAFGELVTPQELIEFATLPLAEQNGATLQRFAKALPPEAVKKFKSHGQVTELFNAWQQHGQQGVDSGESEASAG